MTFWKWVYVRAILEFNRSLDPVRRVTQIPFEMQTSKAMRQHPLILMSDMINDPRGPPHDSVAW